MANLLDLRRVKMPFISWSVKVLILACMTREGPSGDYLPRDLREGAVLDAHDL